MFETVRDYPCAVTGPSASDRTAIPRAYEWVQRRLGPGEQLLVLFPGRRNAEFDPVLRRLAKSPDVVSATTRTLHRERWRGGPVLAVWIGGDALADAADDPRVTALCVVPWLEREAAAWVAAANPEPLGEDAPRSDPAGAQITDPVVRCAIVDVSGAVNHNNELVGSFDKDYAVAALLVLHDGGHRLDADQLYSWALGHGWPAGGATRLKQYATKIAGGTRMRVQSWPFGPDALTRWRQDAAQS